MAGYSSEEFAVRWPQLSLAEQMGNIGSEFDRVISWRKKNNPELAGNAFDRTLELLDLTIADPRWKRPRLKELARTRELVCDALIGENIYNTPPEFLSKYFYQFAVAARKNK
jgi:hypothetical protein